MSNWRTSALSVVDRLTAWASAGAGVSVLRAAIGFATGVFALDSVAGLTGMVIARSGWLVAWPLLVILAVVGERLVSSNRLNRTVVDLLLMVASVIGFQLLPGWAMGWEGRAITALVWRLMHLLLTGISRMGAGGKEPEESGRLHVLFLFLLSWVSLRAYLSPDLIGPKDARWYGNLVMDFLTRLRAGEFPIFSGESVYAFNGSVLTVRTAPAHPYLVGLVDVLTGRSLAPLAAQHIALWLCYFGGIALLYVSLARLRPAARGAACLFATIYAMSPALMTPLIMHDMYMTFTAMPLLVLVFHAVARVVECGAWRHYAWVGLACAGAWYAHPPLAFLGTVGAGFVVAMKGFGEGVTRRWLAGCLIGASLFGALVWPLFYSLAELPPTNAFFPLTNLVLPAAALFLLGYGLVGTACGTTLYPLAFLPTAWLIMAEFKPSLLPFAVLFAGSFVLLAVADRFRGSLGLRLRPEPWVMACAMAAAAAATRWWPERSLPAREIVVAVVGRSLESGSELFRLVVGGSDTQPHAIWWFLLATGLVLLWRAPSRFARGALLVVVAALATIFPVPLLKQFIWSNTTVEIWDMMVNGVWLRFWPFMLPVLLFAVHIMLADLADRSKVRRFVLLVTGLLLPWAVWDHVKAVRSIHVHSVEQTARFYRPENIILQSYSWDHLHMPAYYSSWVIDPRMEIRLWRQGDDRKLLLDPDAIARTMEAQGSEHWDLAATQDPTYPQWIYLSPRIELPAGGHKLLRFDFKGREPQGWLIIRGQDIYREYPLPSSGFARSFGAGPLNTRTVSISNSGPKDEVLELVIKREGPGATDPIRPGEFPALTVSHYDGARSPVEVRSLTPLELRVSTPEKGMLEVFRSAYPGYRVNVNGRRVPFIYSHDGLVAFEVPAGDNEVTVRFRGTWQLRNAFWYALVAWCLAGGYLLAVGLKACGFRWIGRKPTGGRGL